MFWKHCKIVHWRLLWNKRVFAFYNSQLTHNTNLNRSRYTGRINEFYVRIIALSAASMIDLESYERETICCIQPIRDATPILWLRPSIYIAHYSNGLIPHSGFIIGIVTIVRRRVPLVEQERRILPEYMCSPQTFGEARVAWSLVLCVVFCRSLFVLLPFFVLPPLLLSFYLSIMITPLVS